MTLVSVGYIQVKNWKPLCFDAITDSLNASVEEVLGDLIPVATLRVCLARWVIDIVPTLRACLGKRVMIAHPHYGSA